MVLHKWRERPSRHFGNVWVPLAQVELQGAGETYQSLAIPIDSGAVVSLLRRSVAELLGLELESERRIDVGGVGGGKTIAYVHTITTKFADAIIHPVRYAIAETEKVPNLLGRLDVFDHLQIDFDGALQETSVATPWLTCDQRQIWEQLLATETAIIGSLGRLELPQNVCKAITHSMNRGGQLLASMRAMLKTHATYAGPAIIRAMFELALQFEYLLRDPGARSQRYLDFTWVTRKKLMDCNLRNPGGPIGESLANSAMRAEGEALIKKKYEEVSPPFRKGKNRDWDNWYCKSLYDLAKELEWDREYDRCYRLCASWTHGDPFSSAGGSVHPLASPINLFWLTVALYGRMLLRVTQTYSTIVLTSTQIEFLDACDHKFD